MKVNSLWAKRIAHNLVIDHYRVKAKNFKISESTYDNDEFFIFDIIKEPDANIEDKLIQIQINDDLHKMIECLPKIKERYWNSALKNCFKEIAEHTNSSINTTLGRVRYALINL
jgi:RNA polymerase sigma-70 factor (ECF subfamily)